MVKDCQSFWKCLRQVECAPSSSNGSPVAGPSLGRVSVSVARCVEAEVNDHENKKKTKAKKS